MTNAVPAEVSLGSASTGYGVSHIAEEPRGCEACVPGPCCDQALKSETLSFRDAIKFEKLQDMEVPHRAPADAIGDQSNVNLLSKMLVRYMRMASRHLWGPTWTLVDCHGQWLCINRKSHIVNC